MGTSQGLNIHTVGVIVESEENHCRSCGKKLGFFKRMSHADFCSDDHRMAYTQKQNEMALARLRAAAGWSPNENKLAPEAEPARPPSRTTAAA